MGVYDRDYYQTDYRPQFRPQMRFRWPQELSAAQWITIICGGVFLIEMIDPTGFVVNFFSMQTGFHAFELWRYISYQFLHGGFWHLFFNMWALLIFGCRVEQMWGTRKFLIFYLACGVAGGICYPLLAAFGILHGGLPMVGASGAIYGVMAACAMMFPNTVIYINFFFPMRLWQATLLFAVINFMTVATSGPNAGGSAAHIAGLAAGAGYVWLWPKTQIIFSRFFAKSNLDSWERKMKEYRRLQQEVDRILDKVNSQGLKSLTRAERNTLRKATEMENRKNRS